MLIVLVVLLALAGLVVFFAAFRSGGQRRPKGAPESRTGQRLTTLGVAVAAAFGLAVPAIVLASNGANKASVGPGGIHLDVEQQKGRDLFARACAVCHTLAATKSIARTGPNLDIRVGDEIQNEAGRKALLLNAIAEGRARGLGQMPAMLYQGKEAEEVASFVATVAGH
jgi:mono/diheme cytochrome c family protein